MWTMFVLHCELGHVQMGSTMYWPCLHSQFYWPADLFNVGDVVGDPHSLLEDFQISVDNHMALKVPTRQQSYPSGNCPVALIW